LTNRRFDFSAAIGIRDLKVIATRSEISTNHKIAMQGMSVHQNSPGSAVSYGARSPMNMHLAHTYNE